MPAPLAIKLWRVTHPFPKFSFVCLAPFMSQRTFSVTNFPSFVGKRVHRHPVYRPWFSWRLGYRCILSLEAAGFSQALMPSWTSSHFNVMIVSKLCVIRLHFFCFVFFVLLDYILWNKEESTNVKSSYRSFDIREKGQRIGTKPLFGSQLITNLTLKRLEEVGGQFDPPSPVVFQKMYLLNPRVFADFWYYHKSHHFWIFHWNSSSRSEYMKNFFFNIRYFHRFLSIFWIFWHFLVTKKLTASAHNR